MRFRTGIACDYLQSWRTVSYHTGQQHRVQGRTQGGRDTLANAVIDRDLLSLIQALVKLAEERAPDSHCTVLMHRKGPSKAVLVGTSLPTEGHLRAVLGEVLATSMMSSGHTVADIDEVVKTDRAQIFGDEAPRPRNKA
jgi:hypothetical protein